MSPVRRRGQPSRAKPGGWAVEATRKSVRPGDERQATAANPFNRPRRRRRCGGRHRSGAAGAGARGGDPTCRSADRAGAVRARSRRTRRPAAGTGTCSPGWRGRGTPRVWPRNASGNPSVQSRGIEQPGDADRPRRGSSAIASGWISGRPLVAVIAGKYSLVSQSVVHAPAAAAITHDALRATRRSSRRPWRAIRPVVDRPERHPRVEAAVGERQRLGGRYDGGRGAVRPAARSSPPTGSTATDAAIGRLVRTRAGADVHHRPGVRAAWRGSGGRGAGPRGGCVRTSCRGLS